MAENHPGAMTTSDRLRADSAEAGEDALSLLAALLVAVGASIAYLMW